MAWYESVPAEPPHIVIARERHACVLCVVVSAVSMWISIMTNNHIVYCMAFLRRCLPSQAIACQDQFVSL